MREGGRGRDGREFGCWCEIVWRLLNRRAWKGGGREFVLRRFVLDCLEEEGEIGGDRRLIGEMKKIAGFYVNETWKRRDVWNSVWEGVSDRIRRREWRGDACL